MVTCIGNVLYSEDSLFFYSPSRLYMIDCLVRSNENMFFFETHDPMYSLEDDWVSPPILPKSKFLKTSGNTSAKNSFGKRGITHIGVCTLVKVNSAQTRKIIDHLLNQCPFKENLKERYPLQISSLEQSVINSPPPRKNRNALSSVF